MRTRIHYWNCSKLANFIRGTKKPYALEWNQWEQWHKDAKKKHPVRYWIAEELLKKIQNLFFLPSDIYNSIKCYFENRFISKTHFLKTGLRPGSFYELDTRILYGLFNELEEYVECDIAWSNSLLSKKKYKFKKGRCPESGIDYLKWASKLKIKNKLSPQAIAAKSTLKLYYWWKKRPSRPNPMVVSGWEKYCEEKEKTSDDLLFESERFVEKEKILKRMQNIENKYDKEDENMLIEYIKIRKYLWI